MAAVRASGPGKELGESDTGDDILLLNFVGRPIAFKDNSVPGTCTELYTGRARLFGMTVKRVKGKKRSEWDMLGSQTGRDVVRIIRDSRQVVSITMHDRKKGTMVLNVPLLPSTNIAVAADFAKAKRENIRAWVFDAYDFSGGERQMRHFALRFTRDRVRDPNDPTGKKAVQLETSKYAQRFEQAFNAQKRHMEELAPGLLEQAKQAAASGVDGETGFALNPGLEGIMETRTHITEVSEEEETDAYEYERRLKRAQLLQEATARSSAAASPAKAWAQARSQAQASDADAQMKLEQQQLAQNTQQATNGVQGTPVRAAAGPGATAGSHPGPGRMADSPEGSIAFTASPAGATNLDMGLKLTPVQSPAYSTRSGAANRSALRRERQVQQQDQDDGDGDQEPAGRSPAGAPVASGARSDAGPTAGSSLLEPGNKKGAQQGRNSEGGGGVPRRDVHTQPPVKAASGRLHLAPSSPSDAASAGDLGVDEVDEEVGEDVDVAAPPSSLQAASEATAGGSGDSPDMPPSGSGSVASTSVAGGGSEASAARGEGVAASKQPVAKPEPMASTSKPSEVEAGMSGAANAGIALSVVAVAALAGAAAVVMAHKKDAKGRDRSWGEAASAARQAVAKFFGY